MLALERPVICAGRRQVMSRLKAESSGCLLMVGSMQADVLCLSGSVHQATCLARGGSILTLHALAVMKEQWRYQQVYTNTSRHLSKVQVELAQGPPRHAWWKSLDGDHALPVSCGTQCCFAAVHGGLCLVVMAVCSLEALLSCKLLWLDVVGFGLCQASLLAVQPIRSLHSMSLLAWTCSPDSHLSDFRFT